MPSDKKNSIYLTNTGFFEIKTNKIFSHIFEVFIQSKAEERKKEKNAQELSKKELILLKLLEENKNKICSLWSNGRNFSRCVIEVDPSASKKTRYFPLAASNPCRTT